MKRLDRDVLNACLEYVVGRGDHANVSVNFKKHKTTLECFESYNGIRSIRPLGKILIEKGKISYIDDGDNPGFGIYIKSRLPKSKNH
ncbi:MAG TPA: hypothetical protein ENG87_01000 [Candidatus Pacearchaeota archaeon]|nr:hypothetical protein BMS3Abin17_00275 [archaeon BMS3Abin17]HDK41928.1 hypothetical protein [Candidatus Pacearchaeota archaeon]HDZ60356.1 hypothetical protein [Candidatus Pacearchaeota archaeon]